MSESSGKPGFRQVYRQQYREISSSKPSRALRFITPVVVLVVAIFGFHSAVVSIALGALAVILFAVAVVLSRRQRRNRA
jgi:amino acid permease